MVHTDVKHCPTSITSVAQWSIFTPWRTSDRYNSATSLCSSSWVDLSFVACLSHLPSLIASPRRLIAAQTGQLNLYLYFDPRHVLLWSPLVQQQTYITHTLLYKMCWLVSIQLGFYGNNPLWSNTLKIVLPMRHYLAKMWDPLFSNLHLANLSLRQWGAEA